MWFEYNETAEFNVQAPYVQRLVLIVPVLESNTVCLVLMFVIPHFPSSHFPFSFKLSCLVKTKMSKTVTQKKKVSKVILRFKKLHNIKWVFRYLYNYIVQWYSYTDSDKVHIGTKSWWLELPPQIDSYFSTFHFFKLEHKKESTKKMLTVM